MFKRNPPTSILPKAGPLARIARGWTEPHHAAPAETDKAPPEQGPAQPPAKGAIPVEAAIGARLAGLHTSAHGLSSAEATARLERYGPNAIKEKEASRWTKLAGYLWGPIPWMIEAAAVISLLREDWPDFAVVTGLLLYNAAVGFWQDDKAASALAALKKSLARKARVMRDGVWTTLDAAELVPGDVVHINAGEIIPADILLIGGEYLSVDQSALTGESLPASKKRGDQIYSGSIARQGAMQGVVTATGAATFFGRTAKLTAGAGARSHAEQAVLRIGDFLIVLAAALAVALIVGRVHYDFVATHSVSWAAAGAIAQFVLVLLIASIPVAMPAVMSVTMALGALKLSRQKAIVSRLSAIEELAGVDVLCSDKTGTLTQNKLTLDTAISFNGTSSDDIILAAALASQRQSPDPIDQAVLAAVKTPEKLNQFAQTSFTPFDPVNKKTVAAVVSAQGQAQLFAKGAPQAIAAICKLEGGNLSSYDEEVNRLASRGFRALGVAFSDDNGKNWRLLGLLSLMDPPRPDARETVARAKALGLTVKMVTGDDVAIADEIGRQLGVGERLVAANEIFTRPMDPSAGTIPVDQARAVETAEGFARVFPEHKFEIVKALQQRGHLVAMTGDGVNDAPALKQADCGVAVSGATDAARSAAALILTAPGLSTIIDAIVESRRIFQRITNYIYYRIAMTIDIMFVVTAASLVFGFQPLTTVMIVALALLDDIPIMTIAYDNTAVSPHPLRWDMQRILTFSSVMGIMALLQSFGMLLLGLYWKDDPVLMAWATVDFPHIQTMLFLQLAAGGHLLLFVARTPRTVFLPPYPSLPLFLAVVGTQIVAVLMCAYGVLVPHLPWLMIGVVWAYVLIWMVILDVVKLIFFRETEQREAAPATLCATLAAS
jgi:H+-transporting ATPase